MPDWYEELEALFKNQIGKGEMAGTAYDTAWVASVPDPEHSDRPAFPQALEWLRLHQSSDGSWGAEIEYYHDRILSTLIACIVLAEWHPNDVAEYQIEAGLRSIWRNVTNLPRDPSTLVGFELILPTLLGRAEALGFCLPYAHFNRYKAQREHKLSLIPPNLIYSRTVTSTFSLEFLGDQADLGRLNNDLQEGNGSIASSPSASSYFVRLTRDERAMNFLSRVVAKARGAVPTIVPIDVFERVWTLYALYLVDESLPEDVGDSLDALQTSWSPQGLTMGKYYPIPDLDNTALAFFLLGLVGKCPSPDVFLHYAREDHFATYPYERDPSASVHCHLLEALKVYPESAERARMRQQAVDFLAKTQVYETFWFDKWHASPYYTTSHAIIALLDLNTELVQNAITWIIQTQRPDGCWGYRGSTTEETAYALQALAYCARHGLDIPRQALDKAAEWLRNSTERKNAHYRSLFIGKTLFSPTWIVHSVVLSALAMYERL